LPLTHPSRRDLALSLPILNRSSRALE
jgi:hypothetical protein